MIYDVSHNIAKVEEHFIDGKQTTLLVHRKGSTRAFPPHHPLIPVDYQVCFAFEDFINNIVFQVIRIFNVLLWVQFYTLFVSKNLHR